MNVGQRLTFLRKSKSLSQREFAQIIGVSNSAYAMWETGKRQPNLDTIIWFADYYNVTTDYLLGVENENHSRIVSFTNDTFQKLILIELSKYNISEEDFATEVNISLEKMSEYLYGQKCPSPDELIKIADYLGLSLDFLFGRTERRNLSQDEEDLLDNFEKCSNECRKYLISKAGVLAVEGLIAINSENTQVHNQHSLATGTEDG